LIVTFSAARVAALPEVKIGLVAKACEVLSVGVSVTVGSAEKALDQSHVADDTVDDVLSVQLVPLPPVIVVPAVTPGP
jgi:hypothetical protein